MAVNVLRGWLVADRTTTATATAAHTRRGCDRVRGRGLLVFCARAGMRTRLHTHTHSRRSIGL